MTDSMANISSTGLCKACEKPLFALILSAALLPLTANAQGPPDIVWMGGGHSHNVRCVAYSPNGELLASGGWDEEPQAGGAATVRW